MSIIKRTNTKDPVLLRLIVFSDLSVYALLERGGPKRILYAAFVKNLDSIGSVVIFDNSVVAIRTVLTKVIPLDAVVGGVVAKRLDRRKHWGIAGKQRRRKCTSSIFMGVAMRNEHKQGWLRNFNRDTTNAS